MNQLKAPPRDSPTAVTQDQKAKIKHLMSFRIIVDNLLYIIGVPKKFASEQLLGKDEFCG